MDRSVTILCDAVAGRNRLNAQGTRGYLDQWPEAQHAFLREAVRALSGHNLGRTGYPQLTALR
jgi:hypothetical protein